MIGTLLKERKCRMAQGVRTPSAGYFAGSPQESSTGSPTSTRRVDAAVDTTVGTVTLIVPMEHQSQIQKEMQIIKRKCRTGRGSTATQCCRLDFGRPHNQIGGSQ